MPRYIGGMPDPSAATTLTTAGGAQAWTTTATRGGAQAASMRPSPCRRTPERKSQSRSRRVSRSPGRHAEGAPASGSSRAERAARQQSGKTVSVPARDRGRVPEEAPLTKGELACEGTGNENVGVQPVLSRSLLKKAEHSPYRHNRMVELELERDENGSIYSSKEWGQKRKNGFVDTC
jgi:hypothetical protein